MRLFVFIVLATVVVLQGVMLTGISQAREAASAPAAKSAEVAGPSYDEVFISTVSLKVLRHIAEARADIHAGKLPEAFNELHQALTLLDIIESMDPVDKIRSRIWVARTHLAYETSESVASDLAAIYAPIDESPNKAAMTEVRAHVSEAQKSFVKGDKGSTMRELTLAYESLPATEVSLPVSYTKGHVVAAREALMKKETTKADADLKSAEEGIRFLSEVHYMPVTQAKKSLGAAVADYSARNLDATKADLKAGKEYMRKAIGNVDAVTGAEMEKLIKDIESVEKKAGRWERDTEEQMRTLYARTRVLVVKTAERFRGKGDK